MRLWGLMVILIQVEGLLDHNESTCLTCSTILEGIVMEGIFVQKLEKLCGSFKNKKKLKLVLSKIFIVYHSPKEFSL